MPHKPLLLLAILDLFAQGQLPTNFIELNPDLNDLFTRYWSCVVPSGQKSTIAMPFFHLHNEGFWHLVPAPKKEEALAATKGVNSVSQLQDLILGARLDDELYLLLQETKEREMLRAALISRNFGKEVRPALMEQGQVNREAFAYSLDLFEQAHGKVAEKPEKYKPAARDQGFRRAVVNAYKRRCALCGIRMLTPKLHTVVDAAHIVPWSESQNDHITNGMALCRLCHWSFDEGMMGVADDYSVIISPALNREPNVPSFLLTLADRPIIAPEDRDLQPAQKSLSWHRKNIFLHS